jgi:tetratricopeptide (TPR) repeat protein
MWNRLLGTLSLLLCLHGCATAPAIGPSMDGLWQDQAFGYDPALVVVTRESLFALDSEAIRQALESGAFARATDSERVARLLYMVFGPDLQAFAYVGGRSTVAEETWRLKRGDCLSLTIMSLSLARALGVTAKVQEVRVPALFDRRGGVDFVNAHVNLRVRNEHLVSFRGKVLPAADLVIDFEPRAGAQQRGATLDNAALYARFLNNLGAEHLAAQRPRQAYAHFKAAILADPAYAANYGNLAQLYLQSGQPARAEALLLHALSLGDPLGVALQSLQQLMLEQGRQAEAQAYAERLEARRDEDPYHWLGLGLDHLRNSRHAQAVEALERAQTLSSGFAEVHRYLAIAYWRTGQAIRARDQLALLAALEGGTEQVAQLQQKFRLPQ